MLEALEGTGILQFGGLGSWILIGLLAGSIAKFLLPGKDPGGCIGTILIGIVGALLGGFLATYLGFGGISEWSDPRSLVVAVLGSILLLIVLRILGGGKKDKKKRKKKKEEEKGRRKKKKKRKKNQNKKERTRELGRRGRRRREIGGKIK